MEEKRHCYIHLPNEKKLELHIQLKCFARDLFQHVINHFNLLEKEYFGICYKSTGGHYAWLQHDKRLIDHDNIKKSSAKYEFYFAIRHFVASVVNLKHSPTIELFYLHLKSLIYENILPVDSEIAFKLSAYVLQITYGDYKSDITAFDQLRQLALIPDHLLQDHPMSHCERTIVKLYKDLKGRNKGISIIRYIILVMTLPAYGVHYYKVKDKFGKACLLGLSFKGIFQFELSDRSHPIKTYYWQQLENLYFREKKFTIEVADRLQRRSSAGSRSLFSVEPRTEPVTEIRSYSWYGNSVLIKTIWLMSISQHKFYLDNRFKVKQDTSLAQLADDLSNNNNSLILTQKQTMTGIKENEFPLKGSAATVKDSPEVLAAKESLSKALKLRRVELEDRLYDKVQELKKLSLQEADIIGKLPPEYVRYMDLNEKPPKIKKRFGAEFKFKLKNKEVTSNGQGIPSSSVSGINSELNNPVKELSRLEEEFDTLTMIASAAKKLATNSKGRTKKKRWKSFKRTFDKIQAVEDKINSVRKNIGKQPTVRASMLITPEDEVMFEKGRIIFPEGTESDHSSLSEGILLDNDVSTKNDNRLTSSTPHHKHSSSAVVSRKSISSLCNEAQEKRSLTPPPSFQLSQPAFSSEPSKKELSVKYLAPSPQSSSGISSMDSSNYTRFPSNVSPRNWIQSKLTLPKANITRGWNESSLDSIDTVSSASRYSEDAEYDSRSERSTGVSTPIDYENLNVQAAELEEYKQRIASEQILINQLARTSLNHNVSSGGLRSHSALSRAMQQQQEMVDGSNYQNTAAQGDTLPRSKRTSRKTEDTTLSISSEQFRKRSSSLTETAHGESDVNQPKDGTLKATSQPQRPTVSSRIYNVQQASNNSVKLHDQVGLTGPIVRSRSSQNIKNSHANGLKKSSHSKESRPTVVMSDTYNTNSAALYAIQLDENTKARTNTPPITSTTGGIYLSSHQRYQPNYDRYYQEPNMGTAMTSTQRDMLNNEVYQDIGMGWVPSINEYSSRASVIETASVHSRKEDIVRFLEDHIAFNKQSSLTSSSQANDEDYNRRKMRRMREQFGAMQRKPSYTKAISPNGKTWADYKKQPVYTGSNKLDKVTGPSQNFPSNSQDITNKARYLTSNLKPKVPATASSVAYASVPQQELSNAVHQRTQQTNPDELRAWQEDRDRAVKQQLFLRHYLHHNHEHDPTNHMIIPHPDQSHEIARQQLVNSDQYVHSSSAPPGGMYYRPYTKHWMSQINEMQGTKTSQNMEQISTAPSTDSGQSRITQQKYRNPIKAFVPYTSSSSSLSLAGTPQSKRLDQMKYHISVSSENFLDRTSKFSAKEYPQEHRSHSADDLLSTSVDAVPKTFSIFPKSGTMRVACSLFLRVQPLLCRFFVINQRLSFSPPMTVKRRP